MSPLRDQVGQVLDSLSTSKQRLHRGMLLEVLHQIVRASQGGVELTQQRAATDRQGVPVGVDEHEAGHAQRRVAEAFDRATLAGVAVEALFDQARVELHDLLDGHRDLVGSQLAAQRLAVDERLLQQPSAEADALADDHRVGVNSVAATGANTDDSAILDDEPVDHGLGDDHGTHLLCLLSEPRVELRAQDRVGMWVLAIAKVLVVDADGGI